VEKILLRHDANNNKQIDQEEFEAYYCKTAEAIARFQKSEAKKKAAKKGNKEEERRKKLKKFELATQKEMERKTLKHVDREGKPVVVEDDAPIQLVMVEVTGDANEKKEVEATEKIRQKGKASWRKFNKVLIAKGGGGMEHVNLKHVEVDPKVDELVTEAKEAATLARIAEMEVMKAEKEKAPKKALKERAQSLSAKAEKAQHAVERAGGYIIKPKPQQKKALLKSKVKQKQKVRKLKEEEMDPDVVALFEALDKNHSSTVTIDEMVSGFKPLVFEQFKMSSGDIGVAVITNIFNHLDDGDTGYLTINVFDRFIDIVNAFVKHGGEGEIEAGEDIDDFLIRSTFETLDTDQDNSVSFGEFWANWHELDRALALYRKPTMEETMTIFTEFDKDKDHHIELEEYRDFIEALRECCSDISVRNAGSESSLPMTSVAAAALVTPAPGTLEPSEPRSLTAYKDRKNDESVSPTISSASPDLDRDLHKYKVKKKEKAEETTLEVQINKKQGTRKEKEEIDPNIVALFRALDADDDGRVTIYDMNQYFTHLWETKIKKIDKPLGIGRLTKIFNHLDKGDTGYLEIDVFDRFVDIVEAVVKHGGHDDSNENIDDFLIRSAFELIDGNRDGSITFSEFWGNWGTGHELEDGLGLYTRPPMQGVMKTFAKYGSGSERSIQLPQFKEFIEALRLICNEGASHPEELQSEDARARFAAIQQHMRQRQGHDGLEHAVKQAMEEGMEDAKKEAEELKKKKEESKARLASEREEARTEMEEQKKNIEEQKEKSKIKRSEDAKKGRELVKEEEANRLQAEEAKTKALNMAKSRQASSEAKDKVKKHGEQSRQQDEASVEAEKAKAKLAEKESLAAQRTAAREEKLAADKKKELEAMAVKQAKAAEMKLKRKEARAEKEAKEKSQREYAEAEKERLAELAKADREDAKRKLQETRGAARIAKEKKEAETGLSKKQEAERVDREKKAKNELEEKLAQRTATLTAKEITSPQMSSPQKTEEQLKAEAEEEAALAERSSARQKLMAMSDEEILANAMQEASQGSPKSTTAYKDSLTKKDMSESSKVESPTSVLVADEQFKKEFAERKKAKADKKMQDAKKADVPVSPSSKSKEKTRKKPKLEDTEEVQRLRKIFNKLDENDGGEGMDGFIQEATLLRANKALLFECLGLEQLPMGRVKKMLSAAEKGGIVDGKLDFSEFVVFVEILQSKCSKIDAIATNNEGEMRKKILKEQDEMPKEANLFKITDVDNSGGVDINELENDTGTGTQKAMYEYLGLPELVEKSVYVDKIKAAYSQCDADGSGVLDWFEFVSLLKTLKLQNSKAKTPVLREV